MSESSPHSCRVNRACELRGVSKGFGAGSTRVEVLSDLDLDVPEGGCWRW